LTPAQSNHVAWYQNSEGIAGGIWAGDRLDAMLEFVPDSPIPAIQLNSTALVPEPAAGMLLGTGLCAVILLSRKWSSKYREIILLTGSACALSGQTLPNLFPFPNGSGLLETENAGNRPIDLTGAFFESLGANGRSCGSCHRPAQGWSISAAEVALRFVITQGLDPIFRPNDGSNCDHNIDTSTVAGRRKAYSLLIERGLIRIALQPPANAEFNVVSVANPYGCSDPQTLSMYRRPLPTTNLRFLSTLMWDGRESSTQTGTQKITTATNPGDLLFDLAHQAVDATNIHAQAAAPPSPAKQQEIVSFEMNLVTAQAFDYKAGDLSADGAAGGPGAIAAKTAPAFYVGINDPLGGNPLGTPFTPVIFRLFDAWAQSNADSGREDLRSARARIARGQALFNSKPIAITGVAGLNDDLNVASIPAPAAHVTIRPTSATIPSRRR